MHSASLQSVMRGLTWSVCLMNSSSAHPDRSSRGRVVALTYPGVGAPSHLNNLKNSSDKGNNNIGNRKGAAPINPQTMTNQSGGISPKPKT